MFFRYCLFFILCACNSAGVAAQQKAHFQLAPAVCMVQNSDDVCQVDVNFEWQIKKAEDVCILRDQTPLKCWQNATEGRFSYKADVQFGTVYSLVNRKTGKQIASAKIKVQSSNTKSQRRRLRTPWSFF
ncbi:DUF3019 domain-containing protein [Pseudoalteromonas sp. T1lg24]|uniref:DUF3019 domain-containing protein n=1 Tax=Pseudoalteromonas sp. T1lg24 TaxID=2077099 RepID=UPI000CF66F11|nr:DUF3019 domain-containing protein [Pseudoalteromonas sp. T1lg24]